MVIVLVFTSTDLINFRTSGGAAGAFAAAARAELLRHDTNTSSARAAEKSRRENFIRQ
jgi:hypothetical protein